MTRNPFVARGMIKSEKAFWGRSSAIKTVYSLLLDSEEEPQSVAIVGLRKIGKSSLLHRIAEKRDAPSMYADQLDRTVCVMVSLQATSDASTEEFFALLLEELRYRDDPVSDMLSTSFSQPAASPSQELMQLLRLMDKKECLLVLLLDEFECAADNPHFDKYFFDLLRSVAQKWRVAFIVATQNNLDELWDKSLISSPLSSPFFNFFQTFLLSGFDNDEIEDYLKTVSREAGIPFGDPEIGLIREAGGPHPFFLNVAAYHLFQALAQHGQCSLPDRDTLWMQISQDPTVRGNFKYYWQNLIHSRRRVLTEVARKTLSKAPTPVMRVDLDWLEHMGLVRKDNDENYVPFSKTFREFVLDVGYAASDLELGQVDQARTVQDIISRNEGVALELKSSLRWDYYQGKRTEAVELASVKTLAAFMNTDGGTLIIGVDDDGNVLGLDKDYSTLKKQNRDGFELFLTGLVSKKMEKRFFQYIHPIFHSISNLDICKIDVDASPEPVYVGDEADFYIRTGNSTQSLNPKEALEYYRMHWVQ
jgi:hypothetical protein